MSWIAPVKSVDFEGDVSHLRFWDSDNDEILRLVAENRYSMVTIKLEAKGIDYLIRQLTKYRERME